MFTSYEHQMMIIPKRFGSDHNLARNNLIIGDRKNSSNSVAWYELNDKIYYFAKQQRFIHLGYILNEFVAENQYSEHDPSIISLATKSPVMPYGWSAGAHSIKVCGVARYI